MVFLSQSPLTEMLSLLAIFEGHYGNVWVLSSSSVAHTTRRPMVKPRSQIAALVIFFAALSAIIPSSGIMYSLKPNLLITDPTTVLPEGARLWSSMALIHLLHLILPPDGPSRVLKRINDNAYKIELPGNYNVSATFNVSDLASYVGENTEAFDSRTSPLEEGEDDAGADPNDGGSCEPGDPGDSETEPDPCQRG
ncbi:hypothetical protein L1987_12849 [Smallanthus sonchifolius]|uniref:Uncharacterized protein n=1 Tax=Smallanthus sonchifolius TaxID=185202 RepID=A0ACB9JIE2_9ASTR|nr:hypothetical protein L1987_12849 [Smallanthus sonchifolius]